MSIELVVRALQLELPPTKKIILITLANYADEEHMAWPSNKTLCTICQCTTKTLKTHIKGLIASGLISKTERYDKAHGGRQSSNNYFLSFGKDLSLDPPPKIYPPTPSQNLPPLDLSSKELNPPNPPGEEGSQKTTTPPLHGSPNDFDKLWETFPPRETNSGTTRGSKGDARTKWNARCKHSDKKKRPPPLDLMLLSIDRMRRPTEAQYIPNFVTYINQGRWEDFLQPHETAHPVATESGKIIKRQAQELELAIFRLMPAPRTTAPHPFDPAQPECVSLVAVVQAVWDEFTAGEFPDCRTPRQLMKRYSDWIILRNIVPSARGLMPRGRGWVRFVAQLKGTK